ncbi:hypothetical protein ACEV8V_10595 [Vibrio parahaemolyticus]|uniref:hypothetical protein n=1 Tax=Vibrio parahaemolyticus TaxID=670 RepID=UPI001122F776|nr:hypothetical protein [Vibrio parahaemolyticus]TOH40093.1 hypothetical protein CGI82_12665 [Vibrio parahaemolyticus]HCE3428233.1 hypothetical protein [Vibrio parahaemolyticus]HCM1299235.1 hypothetical protein [Vibrio parahaemolyticus]
MSKLVIVNAGDDFDPADLLKSHSQSEINQALFDDKMRQAKESRQAAYERESDSLYMEWQFDQTTESEAIWRSKVAEIKARIPLPVES